MGAVLALNTMLFIVEVGVGVAAGSQALLAGSLAFLGAVVMNGGVMVTVRLPLLVRAQVAVLQALGLGFVGVLVLAATLARTLHPETIEPVTMGVIGGFALAVNVSTAVALMAWHEGNGSVRAVWNGSWHDALGTLAIIVAAALVAVSGAAWPDLVVAAGLTAIFLNAVRRALRGALSELRAAREREAVGKTVSDGHPAEAFGLMGDG